MTQETRQQTCLFWCVVFEETASLSILLGRQQWGHRAAKVRRTLSPFLCCMYAYTPHIDHVIQILKAIQVRQTISERNMDVGINRPRREPSEQPQKQEQHQPQVQTQTQEGEVEPE